MHPLLHSPFLQALGYTIINSLWQFALLWLLYFSINTVFKLTSHQKYAAGFVLEITGFAWFIVTLVFYYNQSVLLHEYNLTEQVSFSSALNNGGNNFKQQFFLLILRFERIFPYLSIAYLALLLVLTVRWMYAYYFTHHVRVAGLNEIEETWKSFVQKLSVQLGIKKPVHIFLSELVQTPLTVGFFKPLILIPVATINYLSPQQLEAVIIHELAHIKRYDYLFNLLLAFIEACLFFNPFMQLIHQQLKKERENCCDDWVLKYNYSAASYARALLQIASNHSYKPLLALNAIDNKKLLISRIKRIIEKNEHTFFNHKHQLLALLVLTTVFSSLSFLSTSKKPVRAANAVVQHKIIFEPMAAKVSNPLFNPVFFLANSSKIVTEPTKKLVETKSSKSKIASVRTSGPASPPVTVASTDPDVPFSPWENTNPAVPYSAWENDDVEQPSATVATSPIRPATRSKQLDVLIENASKDLEKKISSLQVADWWPKEASQQLQVSARNLARFQKVSSKEKDASINLEKVRSQLTTALEQMKSAKKQLELSNLHIFVRSSIKKIKKEKPVALLPDVNVFKLNELELMEKQIEREIDSISKSRFFTAHVNTNSNYTLEIPNVVYTTVEKPHNFSFQYSTKPAVRVRTLIAPREAQNFEKNKEKVVLMNNNDDNTFSENAPEPPVRAPRLRSVYIIKI